MAEVIPEILAKTEYLKRTSMIGEMALSAADVASAQEGGTHVVDDETLGVVKRSAEAHDAMLKRATEFIDVNITALIAMGEQLKEMQGLQDRILTFIKEQEARK